MECQNDQTTSNEVWNDWWIFLTLPLISGLCYCKGFPQTTGWLGCELKFLNNSSGPTHQVSQLPEKKISRSYGKDSKQWRKQNAYFVLHCSSLTHKIATSAKVKIVCELLTACTRVNIRFRWVPTVAEKRFSGCMYMGSLVSVQESLPSTKGQTTGSVGSPTKHENSDYNIAN